MMRSLMVGLGIALTAWRGVATPVRVEWEPAETMPVKAARPFHGFLADGSFLVAGGSDFVDGKKIYRTAILRREKVGGWSTVGELPHPVAEGVSCETPMGLFCAGGTDGTTESRQAFLLKRDGTREVLPDLPAPVTMGAAAADGAVVYVVGADRLWRLPLTAARHWEDLGALPGAPRRQHIAAIQNADQKEKALVVFGGYHPETMRPLHDGFALSLTRLPAIRWKALSPLPEATTTIGAAFLPSGHQHILLIGGFGEQGWIDRALNGSQEVDPVKLGWQRTILAYNAVTDTW
ncbi:MAG: hypothetical protein J6334_02120, partial [Kiritimatiellae bacterium]|nr:hypothetical protein [Kiritimatiellia bacterium]